MMSYKETLGQELNLGDPFQRIHHKLRPLIPRPNYLYSPNQNQNQIDNNPCLNRYYHHHHQHHDFGGNNKGVVVEEGNNVEQQVMVSSRWNPTPEQLTALEELYRCGTRTPSAEQIQHITSQLRRYGKIEGKNVFYWFQNHKARERQKRRRQLQLPLTSSIITSHTTTTNNNNNNRVREDVVHDVVDTIQHYTVDKGPGASRIEIEDGEKSCKRTPFMINNNKECGDPQIIMQSGAAGPRKAEDDEMSSNSDAWLHQFHHNNKEDLFLAGQRNATWPSHVTIFQPPQFSYPPPHQHYTHHPFFSFSSKLITTSSPLPDHESPESGVEERDDNGAPAMGLTLQLFPLLTPEDEDDDEGGGANNADMIMSSLDKKEGNFISCMNSDEHQFVPYYHFL